MATARADRRLEDDQRTTARVTDLVTTHVLATVQVSNLVGPTTGRATKLVVVSEYL